MFVAWDKLWTDQTKLNTSTDQVVAYCNVTRLAVGGAIVGDGNSGLVIATNANGWVIDDTKLFDQHTTEHDALADFSHNNLLTAKLRKIQHSLNNFFP